MGFLQDLFCKDAIEPKPEKPVFDMNADIIREKAEHKKMSDDAYDAAHRKVDDLKQKDEEEKISARSWIPPVQIARYDAGEFLTFGDNEWPRRFIDDIRIVDPGEPPGISNVWPKFNGPPSFLFNQGNGRIEVSVSSGAKTILHISRHKVPFLHEALVKAWKGEAAE